VKVEKQGYFLGSRSFYPSPGTNLVDIKLLKKTKAGSFKATDGGVVNFETVSVDMGSGFVTESGTAYSGNVNVSGTYIDPTADDINQIMPGSLRSASVDGESLLASFGMMAIELTDDNGNPLQLSEGNTAELSASIPEELSSNAPATIPMWYFNEEKGYWVEEGEAQKIGNKYVGSVKHFSFWNYDIKIDAREANGTILHENGTPVQNVRIEMSTTQAGSRGGNTCTQGKYRGLMPINVDITMTISGGPKGLTPFKVNLIVPASGKIQDIVIPDDMFPEPIEVTGKIVDCNNKPTDEARVIIGGRYVATTINGVFTAELLTNSNYSLSLRSKANYKKQKINDISTTQSNLNLGNLQFCPDGATNSVDVDYTDDIKSFSCSYYIDGTQFAINGDFLVGQNKDKNQMSIKIGDGARGTITGRFLEITMLSDFKMDGQPHFYTFKDDKSDKWMIDFTTDLTPNDAIVPEGIRVDFFKWDLSPGGYNKVIFFGAFQEFVAPTGQYVSRSLEDGEITFTMND